MLTRKEFVKIHAMRKRGWTISVIARHVGRDRKTVRAWLKGDRIPGQRRSGIDRFAEFAPYVRARLGENPHLPATVLYGELKDRGYPQSYQTLTRRIREDGLRRRRKRVRTRRAAAPGRPRSDRRGR